MQHQHADFDTSHGRLQESDYEHRRIHVNEVVETSVAQGFIGNIRSNLAAKSYQRPKVISFHESARGITARPLLLKCALDRHAATPHLRGRFIIIWDG